MGKFLINPTKTGFTFHLKAKNGETIGVSEVYTTEKSCKNGIASVIKNAQVAPLEDQTVEGYTKEKCPKFEVYTDKKGELRFRLKASNGQNILASEGYTTMRACKNGIASVRKNVVDAKVEKKEEK